MNTSRSRTVARLAASLVAVLGLAACGSDDRGDAAPAGSSAAGSSPATSSEAGTGTLALTVESSAAGKCAMPSAETLATFDTAFEGTVTSLDDGSATLAVDHWYAGGKAETVTVASPSKALEDLLMAVDLEEGKTYLVSATGDRVTLCGFTAEKSPELEALYAEAFPR
ncbi:hypothetical protein [Nocardioides xinjiangensis]|uniref:hypothetical protein n=1 Tax=Nocardioides xinjiangensis TaxID=2817376 RepID=UPI001B30AB50|nr:MULTISPECIES: hypothetical protein [unclassified Nocardioides]